MKPHEPSAMDRASYRRFLRDLAEADASGLPAGTREARLAQGAARARALLSGLAPPSVPLPVRHASFLERIYADAAAAGEAAVGPLLRDGLQPSMAPTDQRDESLLPPPEVAAQLRELLPQPRVPGWLWTRIRADLRAAKGVGAQRRARSRALAAVLLVGLAGAGVFASIRTDGGTSDRFRFVRETSQLASLNAFDGGLER